MYNSIGLGIRKLQKKTLLLYIKRQIFKWLIKLIKLLKAIDINSICVNVWLVVSTLDKLILDF